MNINLEIKKIFEKAIDEVVIEREKECSCYVCSIPIRDRRVATENKGDENESDS